MTFLRQHSFELTEPPDAVIQLGDWRVGPSELLYRGIAVKLATQPLCFLHTVARGQGRPVPYAVLAEQIARGTVTDPKGLVQRVASHLRKALPAAVPYTMCWGGGYRWSAGGTRFHGA